MEKKNDPRSLVVCACVCHGIVHSLPAHPHIQLESHCVVVVIGQEKSGELITTDPVCFT